MKFLLITINSTKILEDWQIPRSPFPFHDRKVMGPILNKCPLVDHYLWKFKRANAMLFMEENILEHQNIEVVCVHRYIDDKAWHIHTMENLSFKKKEILSFSKS